MYRKSARGFLMVYKAYASIHHVANSAPDFRVREALVAVGVRFSVEHLVSSAHIFCHSSSVGTCWYKAYALVVLLKVFN